MAIVDGAGERCMAHAEDDDQQRDSGAMPLGVLAASGVLAAIAGYVNALLLMGFGQSVSHLTGAVVSVSVDGTSGESGALASHLAIIGGFVVGAMLSGLLIGG